MKEVSQLAFVLDRLVQKSGSTLESASLEARLGRNHLAKVINQNLNWLISGDPLRSIGSGEHLADIFSLTEPHRTFFLGLCRGRSLEQLSSELEIPAPLEFIRFNP